MIITQLLEMKKATFCDEKYILANNNFWLTREGLLFSSSFIAYIFNIMNYPYRASYIFFFTRLSSQQTCHYMQRQKLLRLRIFLPLEKRYFVSKYMQFEQYTWRKININSSVFYSFLFNVISTVLDGPSSVS